VQEAIDGSIRLASQTFRLTPLDEYAQKVVGYQ
jgi:hypothetical protein